MRFSPFLILILTTLFVGWVRMEEMDFVIQEENEIQGEQLQWQEEGQGTKDEEVVQVTQTDASSSQGQEGQEDVDVLSPGDPGYLAMRHNQRKKTKPQDEYLREAQMLDGVFVPFR